MMKILRTLLNVGSKIMLTLVIILKYEIIAISLENIDALYIETVILTLT